MRPPSRRAISSEIIPPIELPTRVTGSVMPRWSSSSKRVRAWTRLSAFIPRGGSSRCVESPKPIMSGAMQW